MQAFRFSLYLAVPIGLYCFVRFNPSGLDYFVSQVSPQVSNLLVGSLVALIRRCMNQAKHMHALHPQQGFRL